ncbi:MAG TPA: DUF418 domain-containing protein [Aliidongia sp.]|nr:DUF418 domain-containing protein [Aliidongia sp.]
MIGSLPEKHRIERLDVLRGIAILGIFFINIAYMGNTIYAPLVDPRLDNWSGIDRVVYLSQQILLGGTQRGMLELLFGACIFLMTVARPGDAAEAVESFHRRDLWLLLFGLVDIFFLGWNGDILHVLAIAGLLVFPLRRLDGRLLILLGCVYALCMVFYGGERFAERSALGIETAVADAARSHQLALIPAQEETLKSWKVLEDALRVPEDLLSAERQAHMGDTAAYLAWSWKIWRDLQGNAGLSLWLVVEAVPAMLLGIGLYRAGILQGNRPAGQYWMLLLGGYGFGLTFRLISAYELLQFSPIPQSRWITGEATRLAIALGHLALINLICSTGLGSRLMRPFAAAGRLWLSLYFLETLIGIWLLFSRCGFDLWGRFGWAQLMLVAAMVQIFLLVAANLWLRHFRMGPLEWLWRSLVYWRLQSLRRETRPATV